MQFTPLLAAWQGVLQHRRHSIILNKHLLLLLLAADSRCHGRVTPLPQQSNSHAMAV